MWFIRQFVFRIDGAGHRLAALVASCAALFLAASTALLSATAPAGTEPSPSEPAPLWSHVRGVADLGEVRDLRPEWDANVTGGTLRLVVTDASPNLWGYAWATVPAPKAGWNLARRAAVEAQITNRGTTPAEVMLWAVGDRGWDAVGDFATLAPGEERKFSCRLRASFPDGTPKLDPGQIKQVQVMLARAARGTALEVRALAAVGQEPAWIRPSGRLDVPAIEEGAPAAGRRVRHRLAGDANPGIYCNLYLPEDWKPGGTYPVIAEYPGNIFFRPACYSTGSPDQCVIGYGMTRGRGAIWVSLPFIDRQAGRIVENGWGVADDTADYAVRVMEEICSKFGGDRANAVLTGFSRGGIACGYIGLRNDRIAALWKGFHACQGYDGGGWNGATMPGAIERARRFAGRATFYTDSSPEKFPAVVQAMAVEATSVSSELRFHACAMFLDDRPATQQLRRWFNDLVGARQLFQADAVPMAHSAVSTRPIADWTAGFLTGNGNIGVIMGGDPYAEKLVINGKLYLPQGSREILPNLSAFKDEFKRAGLAAGKDGPDVVHKLIVEKSGQQIIHTDPNHPAFLLRLAMKGESGAARNYRMTEDFTTGELQVRWSDGQGEWSRRLFVSRPDDVIVMSIDGPKGRVDCELAMELEHPLVKSELAVEAGWIAAHNTYIKGKGGYDSLIRVVPEGGRMSRQQHRLSVVGADRILLIMQVKPWKAPLPKEQGEAWAYSPDHPDYRRYPVTNRLPEMRAKLAGLPADYGRLFAPHAQAHGALYHRVRLDLGGGDDRRLNSAELLDRAAREGTMARALAERLYNACRYLILCASGDTPPNLQGIWNGTWTPAWGGDYTLDSNLQLEVQSMMSCDLPELMTATFDLVDSWLPDWRRNARKIYGFRGVAASLHSTNVGLLFPRPGFPREQAAIGLAGWVLHFYYDYFQFTGDRDFLARRFLPLAKEVALFYEDFLAGTEDASGKYRFYLGQSPEQPLRANTTFDISVAKNVFTTLIAACRELGLDDPDVPKWQAMLAKLPPYVVNSAGELQEWSWPEVAENPNHRHHSHFLPLYQFCEFDRETTPALWRATERAFELKVQHWLRREQGANSNHITHGMMNQGQIAARLGRGDIVYEVLSRMVTRKYAHPSLMIGYWPGPKGFGFDAVGGIPDILNNSLIFGWQGMVDLLPALPKEWPTGSISGVRLRGQIRVQQLAWDLPGGKVHLSLRSEKTQTVTLRFPPALQIPSGPGTPPNQRRLFLPQGQPVQVEFAVAAPKQ
jgi:hypothetical protein